MEVVGKAETLEVKIGSKTIKIKPLVIKTQAMNHAIIGAEVMKDNIEIFEEVLEKGMKKKIKEIRKK
jgi:hypothetical protein